MYKIDNDEMLKFFQANNEIRFFYTCCDIVNAGKEKYGIKRIEFYTSEENKPDFEYIEFIENLFSELIIYIKTTSASLIEAACKKIKEVYNLYNTIRVGTPHIDLMKNDIISNYFNVSDNTSEYSVHALLSDKNLPILKMLDNIEITLASSEQIEPLKNLNNDEWDRLPQSLRHMEQSELLFLLYDNKIFAVYLQANTLYKNFYDIANVFVHQNFRGNGYGILLTVYYANYCLNNGFIPHYGSAISKYSENVALKSGFEETSRSHYFTIKIK
jgi:hypothetical protein